MQNEFNIDNVTIRKVRPHDMPTLLKIEQESGRAKRDQWEKSVFGLFVSPSPDDTILHLILISEWDEQVIGFIASVLCDANLDISNLTVAQEFRRQGVGTRLFDESIATQRRDGQQIVSATAPVRRSAAPFIDKLGFHKIKAYQDYDIFDRRLADHEKTESGEGTDNEAKTQQTPAATQPEGSTGTQFASLPWQIRGPALTHLKLGDFPETFMKLVRSADLDTLQQMIEDCHRDLPKHIKQFTDAPADDFKESFISAACVGLVVAMANFLYMWRQKMLDRVIRYDAMPIPMTSADWELSDEDRVKGLTFCAEWAASLP